jgi:hypothetical protein
MLNQAMNIPVPCTLHGRVGDVDATNILAVLLLIILKLTLRIVLRDGIFRKKSNKHQKQNINDQKY